MTATDRMAYTVAEAARAMRVSPWLIREQCRTGRLRHVRIGHRIVIPVDTLAELLAQPKKDGTAPESPRTWPISP